MTCCLHTELASLSAEGYVNRYRNSWTAAVAATKTFVDDMARKRGRPPAGGRVAIPMADLPVPVPLSRFLWPSVGFLSCPVSSCCVASTLVAQGSSAKAVSVPLDMCLWHSASHVLGKPFTFCHCFAA